LTERQLDVPNRVRRNNDQFRLLKIRQSCPKKGRFMAILREYFLQLAVEIHVAFGVERGGKLL
tara:strand:- start:125 stop:313 length:189 start_codon:yes stop_codon:yes gene_type:complete